MDWTRDECERIMSNYWRTGSARCPSDGSRLSFELSSLCGAEPRYRLVASCPRCGTAAVMDREFDVDCKKFRKWTPKDIAGMVDDHYQRDYVECPVCDSEVAHKGHMTTGGPRVSLECVRCGNLEIPLLAKPRPDSMLQILNFILASIAVTATATTAWLTLWRKGTVKMSRPTIIAFGHDGGSEGPPKVFLRALLYSTAKRGRVVENMFLTLRKDDEIHVFDIWAYGNVKLDRGSGLFVADTGVAHNHHFTMPPDEDVYFAFNPGVYRVELGAFLVGKRHPIKLCEAVMELPASHARNIDGTDSHVIFNWRTGTQHYESHLMKGKIHRVLEASYGPLEDQQQVQQEEAFSD